MPLGQREKRTYMSASLGALRVKADENTPGAIKRKSEKTGKIMWELVYDFVSGFLEKVYYRESEDFGNSWQVLIHDNEASYCVQIGEQSRYCTDLLKKLPNLTFGQEYELRPYDFEVDGKRRIGLSIKQGQEKIPSYYQTFEKGPDGKFIVTHLHGFPEYDGDWKDSDELKIYFMRVQTFLRKESRAWLAKRKEELEQDAAAEAAADADVSGPADDDLPF